MVVPGIINVKLDTRVGPGQREIPLQADGDVADLLFRFGEFELDEPRFELRRAGKNVEIQPKVLDLIAYLVRNRERVVSKTELLDNVWPGVVVSEASLSQAVSAARRVLGDDGAVQSYIKTVRGRGFRLVATVEALAVPGRPVLPAVPPESEPFSATYDTAAVSLGLASASSLELETCDDTRSVPHPQMAAPHLFVALHCEDPRAGGARYSLAAIDEVDFVRGGERSVQRDPEASSRRLAVSLPGSKVSRVHARLLRAPDRWELVDQSSRNGTFVNGERVERATLRDGDVIECGRNLLLFRTEVETPPEVLLDIDSRGLKEDGLGSLLPRQQMMRHAIRRIARSGLSLLVLGEPGTGKDLAARAFHALSGRSGPLVTVPCGAIPAERLEVALQGSTGAGGEQLGYFREASGGTLFLDQVESLSLASQASLLRCLEELMVVPVGSSERVPVDVRVIAASALPLDLLAQRGDFRPDLYGRLAGFVYRVPALCDRRGDLGLLAASLLTQLAPGRKLRFSPTAGLALLRYHWPGNVRELRQTLVSALALLGSSSELIEPTHLPDSILQPAV